MTFDLVRGLVACVVLSGCSTTQLMRSYEAGNIREIGAAKSAYGREVSAFAYSLPITVLTVSGSSCSGQPTGACKPSDEGASYAFNFSSEVLADPKPGNQFLATVRLRDWATLDQTIDVNAKGLLDGATSTVTDTSQSVIVDLFKVLALGRSETLDSNQLMGFYNPLPFSSSGTRAPPFLPFDPRKHELAPFRTTCFIDGQECNIRVPVAGRAIEQITNVTSEPAAEGLVAGQSSRSIRICEDSRGPCLEITERMTVPGKDRLADRVSTTRTVRWPGVRTGFVTLNVSTSLSDSAAPILLNTSDNENDGLRYRSMTSSRVSVTASELVCLPKDDGKEDCTESTFQLADITQAVVDPRYTFATGPISRSFTTSQFDLNFADGVLNQVDTNLPGPAAQIAATPVLALQGTLEAVKGLLTARVEIKTQEAGLVEQETELLKALTAFTEAQAELEEARDGLATDDSQ